MKYLIAGGVAGGATIAARLKRNDENAEIILFEKGGNISYANCGLPYYIGGTIQRREDLIVQTVTGFINRYDIDIRIKSEIEKIDTAKKCVIVHNIEKDKRYEESYDKLILSPGAEPFKPGIPGIESRGIFTLRNIPDTDSIKGYVDSHKIKKAVIVGGGFIGLEMAENLHNLGIEVSVVEMADQVMANLDFSMAALVHAELRSKGVELRLKEAVDHFNDLGDILEVCLKSGELIKTQLVIWSIGVKPEVKLAREAGLEIGTTGGIKVNEYLQTSDENI